MEVDCSMNSEVAKQDLPVNNGGGGRKEKETFGKKKKPFELDINLTMIHF